MGKLISISSSVFLAIGGYLFGFDLGIITSTIAQPYFLKYFGGSLTDAESGGIVSAITGGAIVGSAANYWLGDVLGRRWTIFVGAVVSVLGCALQAGTTTIAMMIAGRFIAGLALGLLTSTVPLFCAEISEKQFRGAMSGLLQWMLSWGFLSAQWIGYGCTFVQGRFPLAFQCIPGLILAIGVPFLPESPRWLCEKNRDTQAKQVLTRLRSGKTERDIELEYREISDVIAADRAHFEITWSTIWTKTSWRKRLLLGCGVQLFCQLSGINVINYYGPRIYEALGIGTQTSLMIIGISGALSIIYCTAGLWITEKVGRIKPLIVSALGMAACLMTNAVLSQYFHPSNHNQLRAMVAMNFLISLFFTMTGIISWVYPAEIFPVEIRAKGNAAATTVNWCMNLLFAQCSPLALSALSFKYFYLFFATNLIAAASYILFYPETKGRTLEQMDELFGDQLVPHAMEDPQGAQIAMEKPNLVQHVDEVAKL